MTREDSVVLPGLASIGPRLVLSVNMFGLQFLVQCHLLAGLMQSVRIEFLPLRLGPVTCHLSLVFEVPRTTPVYHSMISSLVT